MNAILIIIILLGIGMLVGLGLWLFLVLYKEEEAYEDNNIIINFLPQHTTPTKGCAIGAEVSTTKIGDRSLIEMKPKDIKNKGIKNLKDVPNVTVAVDKNKMDVLPLGDWSNQRNIKIIWPPSPEDFPIGIKQSRFGQFLMKYVEKLDVDNVEIDTIREGSKRKTKLLKEMGDGEISEEYIESRDELTKDLLKSVSEVRPPARIHAITPTREII